MKKKKKSTPYDHIRKPLPKPSQAHKDRRRRLLDKALKNDNN